MGADETIMTDAILEWIILLTTYILIVMMIMWVMRNLILLLEYVFSRKMEMRNSRYGNKPDYRSLTNEPHDRQDS